MSFWGGGRANQAVGPFVTLAAGLSSESDSVAQYVRGCALVKIPIKSNWIHAESNSVSNILTAIITLRQNNVNSSQKQLR